MNSKFQNVQRRRQTARIIIGLPLILASVSILLLMSACAKNPTPLYGGGGVLGSCANTQTRIVVLPFYTEEGSSLWDSRHYRRVLSFIDNQLVRHGFEVVNRRASELKEAEYNRYMQKAQQDSALAAADMCKKYSTDLAYIVWLHIKQEHTKNGLCRAKVRLEGEGYDSAGRDLGAAVSKTFVVTRSDCDDAIAEAEKEVADLVGRKLTAWSCTTSESMNSSPPYSSGGQGYSDSHQFGNNGKEQGGVLQRRADALENLVSVRLDGATEYELEEVFGKVLNTARGVVEAKRYRSRIVPDNPQASMVIWRVRVADTEPFRLQVNIIKMINDILDSNGKIYINGVHYRYSLAEVDLLKGIRSGDCSSREINFIIDRERARDREFEGRHDPYKTHLYNRDDQGFE
ncbi:MAG: hypothetical protein LWX01_07555 [Deltaproteobacteria bacterium]|nr:hypothetical protein [Deltaproteobacteria bacterium]MDL1961540.1 hypothetical protein [Deltaproteobacteria bacterium]